LTIYNDGRLPENWTVADLLLKHRSRPYNPKIASVFFRAGFIETWGRGIERITTACKEAGKREPLFEAKPSEIAVTFYRDDNITESIAESITESVLKNEMQKRIVAIMSTNPSVAAKALAEELGIAERNVKNHIKALKDSGMIDRVGAARGGYWIVKPSK